jgi:inner membrane protein
VALRRPESIRLAALLVVAVFAADLFWSLVEDSTGSLAYALVDEPAHLATCAIALLVFAAVTGSAPARSFAIAALLASTAIDVDHLPHYLGSQVLMGAGLPRPYTHSLLFVALLLALGWALRSRRREVALGIAFGIAAHLLRDLATGPGVPFLWPLSAAAVSVPYVTYAAALLLAVATVALSARRRPARRRLARQPLGARPLPNAGRSGGS